MRNTNENKGYLLVGKHFDRRRFLQLMILSGMAVGCQRLTSATPDNASTNSPGTLAFDLRFALENAAVTYSPHPRGCNITSIRGSVHAADGSSVTEATVRVWGDDVDRAITLSTDTGGYYSCDVAPSLSNETFHIQLTDPAVTTLLSDVIIAQAVSSCDLNLMTVDFVAAQ